MIYTLKQLMELCTEYANCGVINNIGGPFGAAVVKPLNDKEYELISLARNEVISTNKPTSHAEINAINMACEKLNTFDLTGYILISTGQSCPMCLSAAIWANISKIIYGTDYIDAEKIAFRDKHIFEHLNGKIKAIEEEQKFREIALRCQQTWKDKNDKKQY